MNPNLNSLIIEVVAWREYRLAATGTLTTGFVVAAATLTGIALGLAYLTWT